MKTKSCCIKINFYRHQQIRLQKRYGVFLHSFYHTKLYKIPGRYCVLLKKKHFSGLAWMML